MVGVKPLRRLQQLPRFEFFKRNLGQAAAAVAFVAFLDVVAGDGEDRRDPHQPEQQHEHRDQNLDEGNCRARGEGGWGMGESKRRTSAFRLPPSTFVFDKCHDFLHFSISLMFVTVCQPVGEFDLEVSRELNL
jgi:hypothetical protein